jgi:WD40 repeat protein
LASLTALAFSPDDQTLISVDETGAVLYWPLTDRQALAQRTLLAVESFASAAFNPDRSSIAISDFDRLLTLDVVSNALSGPPLLGHTWAIDSLAYSHDGRYLASGGDNGPIFIWDLTTQQPVGLPLVASTIGNRMARSMGSEPVKSLAFSLDDKPGFATSPVISPSGTSIRAGCKKPAGWPACLTL